jgi:Flp pilus assembly protein TadG
MTTAGIASGQSHRAGMGRRRRERGAILVWFALGFLVIVGFIGIAVDVGRMYLVRTEGQTYVDAGALAAAAELDGTSAGITRAVNAAGTGWTKYHLHSLSFAAPTVEFATSSTGVWKAPGGVPSPPTDYRFARVTTNVTLPMYLMPVFTGTDNATVAARAVAGQINITSASEGLLPFTVMAHSSNPTAANGYGLIRGQSYTLRWESGANSDLAAYMSDPTKKSNQDKIAFFCAGDKDPAYLAQLNADVQAGTLNLNDRGFIVQSASDAAASVIGGFQSSPISADPNNPTDLGTVSLTKGAKQAIVNDLNARSALDTNHSNYATDYNTSIDPATIWASFNNPITGYYGSQPPSGSTGNGWRIAVAPLTRAPNQASPTDVLSFALFLLDPTYPNGANNSWCATYLGSGVEWSYRPGGSSTGLFALRLVQ